MTINKHQQSRYPYNVSAEWNVISRAATLMSDVVKCTYFLFCQGLRCCIPVPYLKVRYPAYHHI